MLLVNDDDDDVGFSLAVLYDSATFCVFKYFYFLYFFCVCACGCVHNKLPQYAFTLLQ